MCRDQSIDWLVSIWFRILLKYFRTASRLVSFLNTAITNCPFIFYICGDFVLGGFLDFQPLVLLKSSFVGVFQLFVCSHSAGAYFDDFFGCMCFLLIIVLYPLDTLTEHFAIFWHRRRHQNSCEMFAKQNESEKQAHINITS